MAQLPIDQRNTKEAPMGRDEIWPRVRERFGDWFTVSEIKGNLNVHARTILSFLQSLVAAGHMARREGDACGIEYRLLTDLGHHTPRFNLAGKPVTAGSGVDNMWRTMRIQKQFDADDLAMLSTTEAVSVKVSTAQNYCSMLFKSGYLKVVRKAVPGKGRTIYRLIQDTGPKAPKIQNVKRVWDPNLRRVMAEVSQ